MFVSVHEMVELMFHSDTRIVCVIVCTCGTQIWITAHPKINYKQNKCIHLRHTSMKENKLIINELWGIDTSSWKMAILTSSCNTAVKPVKQKWYLLRCTKSNQLLVGKLLHNSLFNKSIFFLFIFEYVFFLPVYFPHNRQSSLTSLSYVKTCSETMPEMSWLGFWYLCAA